MRDLPRRRFLSGAGALAVAPAAARLVGPERAQPVAAPFLWGLASFDPTPSSVLLWTRVVPPADHADVPLTWQLAEDEAMTLPAREGAVVATADRGHCVRVLVDDLAEGRTWWFRFTGADGSASPVARTRTLPADPERLRIGVVSCARYADGSFGAYGGLAERDVDLVLHVGDYIYEDGFDEVRAHDPPHRCTTLADYRARYAQHRADADLQRLHARHPMVAVWDDHDIAGNAWRDGAAQHDDERDGPWPDRVRAASRAHDEWLPGRTSFAEDGRLKAWRSLELGRLAELVVLDTRLWGRDRQPATADELAEPDDGDDYRRMLGDDQMAFVRERLRRDERPRWVFLANQVMFHPLRIPAITSGMADQAEQGGFLISEGFAVNPDQWDGYPRAQSELLVAIGGQGGVVALTGDVHSSWGWVGPANDGGNPTMVELVAPSVSSKTFAERIPVPATTVEAGLQLIDRDLAHVELTQHGYLLVDCTEDRLQAEWWYLDGTQGAPRFGAARSTSPDPPMRLREELEPTPDRAAGDQRPPVPTEDLGPEDEEVPWATIGIGTAAGAAAVALGLAVRGRRRGA